MKQRLVIIFETLYPLILTAVPGGIYFFSFLAALLVSEPRQEREEWLLYITGWLVVPVLTMVFAFLFLRLSSRAKNGAEFLAVNATLSLLTWIILIYLVRMDLITQPALLIVYPLVSLLIVYGAWYFDEHGSEKIKTAFERVFWVLPPYLILGILVFFSSSPTFRTWHVLLSAIFALIAAKYAFDEDFKLEPNARYVLAAIGIALIVINLRFPYDQHHYNYYLGPVNHVLHGSNLMVDINSQYGVGVILFTALALGGGLLPITYHSFSLLISMLLVVQFWVVFYLLHKQTRSFFISAFGTAITIGYVYFFGNDPLQMLPATGPLRFLLPLVLCAVLIKSQETGKPRYQLLEGAILGIAFIWSFENFIYVTVTYFTIIVFDMLAEFYESGRFSGKSLQRGILKLLVPLAIAFILLSGVTLLRSGQWPDWWAYFQYPYIYSVGEHMTVTIDFWWPWPYQMLLYFASLITIAFLMLRGDFSPTTRIMLALTILGLAQFTYFLGRSTLLYLRVSTIPSIVLAFFWITRLAKASRFSDKIPPLTAKTWAYVFFYGAMMVGLSSLSKVIEMRGHILGYQSLGYVKSIVQNNEEAFQSQFPYVFSFAITNREVIDSLSMVERLMPEDEKIAIVISPEQTTETLLTLDKPNAFPFSNFDQDNILLENFKDDFDVRDFVESGDIVIIQKNDNQLLPLQSLVIDQLEQYFHLEVLSARASGVRAVRLK